MHRSRCKARLFHPNTNQRASFVKVGMRHALTSHKTLLFVFVTVVVLGSGVWG